MSERLTWSEHNICGLCVIFYVISNLLHVMCSAILNLKINNLSIGNDISMQKVNANRTGSGANSLIFRFITRGQKGVKLSWEGKYNDSVQSTKTKKYMKFEKILQFKIFLQIPGCKITNNTAIQDTHCIVFTAHLKDKTHDSKVQ